MTREIKIGGLLALLCFGVFVAVVISTVEARGELEAELELSLREELSGTSDGNAVSVRCEKRVVSRYECVQSAGSAVRRVYRTSVTDDGCWTAVTPDAAATVSGCQPD